VLVYQSHRKQIEYIIICRQLHTTHFQMHDISYWICPDVFVWTTWSMPKYSQIKW